MYTQLLGLLGLGVTQGSLLGDMVTPQAAILCLPVLPSAKLMLLAEINFDISRRKADLPLKPSSLPNFLVN